MVTGIDVTLYAVKDFDRAVAFYTAFIGHEPAMAMPGAYAEYELADGATFALGKHPSEPWTSGYLVMLAVPDVGEAATLVRSLGGTATEPSESPVCHMSFAEDTEGNRLVLHRRK